MQEAARSFGQRDGRRKSSCATTIPPMPRPPWRERAAHGWFLNLSIKSPAPATRERPRLAAIGSSLSMPIRADAGIVRRGRRANRIRPLLAGGCTVRMDERISRRIASPVYGIWSAGWPVGGRLVYLLPGGAFRKIGGFNLELFASEELDLSKRLKSWRARAGRKW